MAEELYGIVSELDEEHQEAVWRLWTDVEREFGVSISKTHVPHFTYHCAKSYGASVHRLLANVAATMAPAVTASFILGVFNAPPPLFFLPLVRTADLNSIHRRLWADLGSIATGVMDRYAAERWFATVNLAPDLENDISRDLLPFLLQRDVAWSLTIDNICLLHDTGERQIIEARFRLTG
ncbi:MAG: hypothetical protein E6J43_07535 [Chloroflexi bacterium]|nr:MAG: hypothetical protein E6J43_07535 [Chloroflexota bacterium]